MNSTEQTKPKPEKPAKGKPLKITRFQKFQVETIDRALIKNAPYNPRVISDAAKKKLRANLRKRGLLETLVVNRTTMNLVSGHRRIGILDDLEGSPHYMLTVAMVELTEDEEREQNIFMNNTSAQGDYDIPALEGMFQSGLDYEAAGFEQADMAMLDLVLEAPPEPPPPADVADMVDKIKDRKKAAKAASRDTLASGTDTELRIAFPDSDALYDYLESLNLTADCTWIRADRFEKLMAVRYAPRK